MKIKLLLYLTLLLSILFFNLARGQSDFDIISGRIVNKIYDDIQTPTSLDNNITGYLNTIQTDGSWNDINYSDTSSSIWRPYDHLARVLNLSKGYTLSTSSYYRNAPLYTAIINALEYWNTNDFQSSNWWWNQIANPKIIGEILLLLKIGQTAIPADLETNLISQMNRGNPEALTGANKLDVAIHFLYRACIVQDETLLQYALNQAFEPIQLTTEEGIQYDYSYQQHGSQLMIASYGSVFLDGEFKIASYVRETAYSLPDHQLEILSTYYKDTYLKAIRGAYMDFSADGRGISGKNALLKNKEHARLETAKLIAPAYNSEWDAAIARTTGSVSSKYMIMPNHKHFYSSDYTRHQRSGYNLNIRTVSSRTKRTESGNDQNLKGKFLPDGATTIQRRGGEYYNIMPIWEWDKIPGTTSGDFTQIPAITVLWGEPGSTEFVGGVNDSLYGATTYDMSYYNTKAKKSWFFFDKEVVCLGAGVNSTLSENITTTINQCWLIGAVTVSSTSGGTNVLPASSLMQYTAPRWVQHDSIGYFFPQGGDLKVSNLTQSGNWYDINRSQPNEVVSGDVFKMWLDHGAQPSSDTYFYIVVPGLSNTAEMEAYDLNAITIVENTSSTQAVLNSTLDMMQIVFHDAGTVVSGPISVTVNKPCVMLLKNVSSTRVDVSIADPAQQQSNITAYFELPAIEGVKQLDFTMPVVPHAGATVNKIVDAETPDKVTLQQGLPIVAVTASSDDGNMPGNTIDDNLNTRWSALGDNEWIRYDLGSVNKLMKASIAWYKGNERTSSFDIEVSLDGINWINVYSGVSRGTTLEQEDYDITDTYARYFRIVGHGNSNSMWNSITETDIFGSPKTIVYTTIADSYTRDGSYANTNYGTAPHLVAKNDATGYKRETFVKFNVALLPQSIGKAKLKMYSNGAANTKWELYKVGNNWTETGLTTNNAPASEVLVATVSGTPNASFAEWNIKPVLDTLSGTEVSFKIVSTAIEEFTTFASKEASNSMLIPSIVVEEAFDVTVDVVADSYTRDGSYADTNYGTATHLVAKNDGTGYKRETFVKFDLSGINDNITQGNLQMYSNETTSSSWELYKVRNDWTETGITANNAPYTEVLIATSPGTSGAENVIWDVSSVLDSLAGNIVSFKVISTVTGEWTTFASREAVDTNTHPKLLVQFTGGEPKIPEEKVKNAKIINANYQEEKELVELDNSIIVYPNPVLNSDCTLRSDKPIVSISLYHITRGKIFDLKGGDRKVIKIPLYNLQTGMYIIHVRGEDYQKQLKVIKQ
ncbi:polysaccharide lyase family 8 super-sandwich domain-containing protein [Sunxiuqinia rutila]|uniref:polysaccharide lyase family 8 super-sandwich domain-containing protein n=1 Tax=Sunxiuqinia rutila TaxID=1397841 RepID=UPI003D35A433